MDERDSFESFCLHAHPRLVAALAHHSGDRWLAEEAANDALVRAAARWHRVSALESPVGWCYRVGVNLMTSAARRRAAERRARERLASAPRPPEADETTRIALVTALGELPERQRQAVILRYYLGLSAAEAGATLDCTPGAVRVLTHRGVQRLGQLLGLDLTEGPGEYAQVRRG